MCDVKLSDYDYMAQEQTIDVKCISVRRKLVKLRQFKTWKEKGAEIRKVKFVERMEDFCDSRQTSICGWGANNALCDSSNRKYVSKVIET